MPNRNRSILFGPVAALLACSSPAEPALVTRLEVGMLTTDPAVALGAPDTVFVGAMFNVTVTTEGSSCETAAGGVVRVNGLTAEMTPYNMVYQGPCDLMLVRHPRAIPISFAEAGTAIVRVVGASGTRAERTLVVRVARGTR